MSKPEAILSDFLTKQELASELQRSPRTLDRWEVLGIGPPRTLIGRTALYRRTSAQKWLAAQERQASCGAPGKRTSHYGTRATA
jgi:hypothetical protein